MFMEHIQNLITYDRKRVRTNIYYKKNFNLIIKNLLN